MKFKDEKIGSSNSVIEEFKAKNQGQTEKFI
jgi:hypothetical protein